MKTLKLITLFLGLSLALQAQSSSDSIKYKDRYYAACIGSKGGVYFITEDSVKHYRVRSVSSPKDNGNGTAKYKDTDWKIFTGSRGGRYIVYKGQKIYIPKS